jgi:hypothetical protein
MVEWAPGALNREHTTMPLAMEESPGGSVANAVYLAAASDVAYYNEPEGPQKFNSELGLDAKLFSAGNTAGPISCSAPATAPPVRGCTRT